ncbi:MAG TPA: acyl-CoA dehydrogenase family protein [Acidimicrobiia bacterium]|nr:acyl-CoA dehydrogenase family protein [Acidimicrobiia bacterium]
MRFAFTDEQLAMRDAVRDFLEKECPPTVVRDAWTNDSGRSGLWRKLGEIGVLGVLAPEAQGGFGGNFLDLILLLEETGRAALPEPIVEHAAVAVPELDDATEAVAGAITVTVVDPPSVLYADNADMVWANGQFVETGSLVLARRETVDRSRRVSAVNEAWMTIAPDAAERGALGTAAQLLGLAQQILDLSVEYAKQRHQFGAPIGSFQAIKHKLADVRLALEFARPVVYRAAYSVAHEDRDRPVHVSMAKAYASEAALLSARHALQVHGAIGYSYEHDLHLWMKRAWALAAAWGDSASHRRSVGRAILDRDREEQGA